jgi:eukaryotic-like serine/threonine-protein kinase
VPEVAIPMASVPGHHFQDDWSPDGQQLSIHSSTPETALDVWVVSIEGREAREIARSTFQEHSARFSPAGRLIAYVSDESGAPEVYVQMLGKPGKRRISTSGGVGPRWRGNGRELFFIDGANRLTAVAVGNDESLEPSLPVALFDACGPRTPEFLRYEVAADGSRSLWVCPAQQRAPSTVTISIPGLPGASQAASHSKP